MSAFKVDRSLDQKTVAHRFGSLWKALHRALCIGVGSVSSLG